jgi:trimethyllysine dioxygenase
LYDRSIFNHLSYNETIHYYQAIKRFAKIIQDSKNELWMNLKKDQIVIIDNFRILHGRSGFSGDRVLLTAYAPRDEFISKARLMEII